MGLWIGFAVYSAGDDVGVSVEYAAFFVLGEEMCCGEADVLFPAIDG